jgi:hypothetical protein
MNHSPVVGHSQRVRPCRAPYKMNADMAIVLDCGICPDTRNTLAIVQTVPWFTVKRRGKREKTTWLKIWKIGYQNFLSQI